MSYPPLSDSPSPPHVIPVKFRRKSSVSEHEPLDEFARCQRRTISSLPLGEGTMGFDAMKKNLFGSKHHMHHWARNIQTHFSSYDEDPFELPPSDNVLPSSDTDTPDDQCEEHDLESMDIHLRESYFEVSAERGRWKSSPIIPRTRTHIFASSPTRTCSTPAVTLGPFTWKRPRRESTNSVPCTEVSTSSVGINSEDLDESRFSSPLPSSSPPTSPVSFALSLPEEYRVDEDEIVDPTSLSPLVCPFIASSALTSSYQGLQPSDHARVSRGQSRVLHLESCSPPANVTPDNTQCTLADPFKSIPYSPCLSSEQDSSDCTSLKAVVLSDVAATRSTVPCSNIEPDSLPLALESYHAVLTLATTNEGEGVDDALPCLRKGRAKLAHGNSETNRTLTKRNSNTPSERPVKKCKKSDSRNGGVESRRPMRTRTHVGKPLKRGRNSGKKSSSDALDGQRTETCSLRVTSSEIEDEQRDLPQSKSCIQASSAACRQESPMEHTELTGMLVEALATSRATSMDTAALYLVLTRAHPKLKTERPKKEVLKHIGEVLEAGRARCGMFERVGEPVYGHSGDEESVHGRWFYVPERDEDRERAGLISALAPRQKRSETKKYKQYYWRPLDRISRWDPEDAL